MASPNAEAGDLSTSTTASPRMKEQQSTKTTSTQYTESISPSISGRPKRSDHDNEHAFNLDRSQSHRHHRFSGTFSRKLISRPSVEIMQRARTPAELLKLRIPSIVHNTQYDDLSGAAHNGSLVTGNSDATGADSHTSRHRRIHQLTYHDLWEWIEREKSKRSLSKYHRRHRRHSKSKVVEPFSIKSQAEIPDHSLVLSHYDSHDGKDEDISRRGSASSNGSIALEALREIVESLSTTGRYHHTINHRHSTRSLRKLKKTFTTASDPDIGDNELFVPSCDVFLDNSKTLSNSGGLATVNNLKSLLHRTLSSKERDAWKCFKVEIVKIAHTLGIKGWRRVPLDDPDAINVERLSGALTNAVYVVSPPKEIQVLIDDESKKKKSNPKKLLLRIYGSNVDHLIDRESELQILRRLSKKRIGPCLLGIFENGRFEEYLNAGPLVASDLRISDVSRQIAKRMRELHDGVELLDSETEAGPFVWQNIDKWIARGEYIVNFLEEGMKCKKPDFDEISVRERFVGASFELFKEALCRYRKWIKSLYEDGELGIRERLVFAHNDAQYGNILRLMPDGESPLLLPMNEHKRLVVIDFEYANANVPGLEFANHFTEWCYNYHDEDYSFLCNVPRYPNTSEQINFLTAYVMHRPSFQPAPGTLSHRIMSTASSAYSPTSSVPNTPAMLPMSALNQQSQLSNGSISSQISLPATAKQLSHHSSSAASLATLYKDVNSSSSTSAMGPNFAAAARVSLSSAPPSAAPSQRGEGSTYSSSSYGGGSIYGGSTQWVGGSVSGGHQSQQPLTDEEAEYIKKQVDHLMWETRAWRGINSAQWILWGLVQAKIPGFSEKEMENDLIQTPIPHEMDKNIIEPKKSIFHDSCKNIEGSHHNEFSIDSIDGKDNGDEEVRNVDKETEGKKGHDDHNDRDNYDDDHEGAFNYLAYSRERAAFFWGDVISLGIMNRDELPEEVINEARVLDY